MTRRVRPVLMGEQKVEGLVERLVKRLVKVHVKQRILPVESFKQGPVRHFFAEISNE